MVDLFGSISNYLDSLQDDYHKMEAKIEIYEEALMEIVNIDPDEEPTSDFLSCQQKANSALDAAADKFAD